MGANEYCSKALHTAVQLAKRREATIERGWQQARRAALITQIKAAAVWCDAEVELTIAEDVQVGAGVRVRLARHSHNVLTIGPGTTLGDRVLILLKGGQVLIGPDNDIRRDVVFNVAGRLEIVGATIVSWGSVIHCANEVTLSRAVNLAERVTIVDSTHYFSEPGATVHHNTTLGAVSIGEASWICPNAVLTHKAVIGDHAIVGSGSVVIGPVPSGHLASGVPATLRPISLPWESA